VTDGADNQVAVLQERVRCEHVNSFKSESAKLKMLKRKSGNLFLLKDVPASNFAF
jgi:hypothetical protein